MASGTRKRVRYTFDVHFSTQEEKEAFVTRLGSIRKLLTPSGSPPLDNLSLFSALCDSVETDDGPMTSEHDGDVQTRSFMRDCGVYLADGKPDDSNESMFVTEYHCFEDLLTGLASPCPCGNSRSPWSLESVVQKGHVLRVLFQCRRCKKQRRTWSSSRVFGGHYLVNQKFVHGFTCAGILPSQYTHLCKFVRFGGLGHDYIRTMYHKRGYKELIGKAAEKSMQTAVDGVKKLPDYPTKGEWVITDARHDSTANAYHTTVPCLSGNTHKILGISTIARTAHGVAQTRELACTKEVIPQVQARGLHITEVAHDIATSVSSYITRTLGLVNSYDTWHGTKNVGKEMQKIASGRVRDRGKTWFPQLVDKQRSIKIHLYWAMKNCEDSPSKLQHLILNIPQHYKGFHANCPVTSSCHTPAYSPSKDVLTDARAEVALVNHLKATYIYRQAGAFCRCRDTYWVESFNHQLLTYLPKRIHFSTSTFTMRMYLAVMDWNENVNRAYTSMRKVKDLRRPDRRTPMKVLKAKTFKFVESLWMDYVALNKVDVSELSDDDDLDGNNELIEDGLLVPMDSDDESEDEDD